MFKNLVLLVFSIFLVLTAGELYVRYRVHAWPFEHPLHFPEYLTADDVTLRWRFSPSNGRNSLGLQNREVGPKQSGNFRILFLGDSLIWSGQTSSGEQYTEVLERRFNAVLGNGQSVIEVINAGIPGYTTYQEFEFLKIYGIDMKPDLVVLGFVFNDLFYKYLHRPTTRNLIDLEPASRLYRFDPLSLPGVMFAKSQLAHELVARSRIIWHKLLKRPMFRFEQKGDFYLAWKDYGWHKTRELIGEMKAFLGEKGIDMAVVVFPISDQVNDHYLHLDERFVLYPQTQIRKICDEYEIPMLDLTDSLHKNGGEALFSDYLHLNGRGNDVVADQVERFLIDDVRRLANVNSNR